MTLNISNPWEDQYACIDSPQTIRDRITLRPSPLLDLIEAPTETAVQLLNSGLRASYTPNSAEISFIQMQIGSARAHARLRYVDQKMFARSAFASKFTPEPATPYMLCGQAGVGKSALASAMTRLFEPSKSLQISHFNGSWELLPIQVISVQGAQSLSDILRRFSDHGEPEPGKRSAQVSVLLSQCARRLYQSGCCKLAFDEFQFVSLSSSANTLVTKILLGLTFLGVPFFFVCNFSLVHRLLSRNTEEIQRLLSKVVVLEPDLPDSQDWENHLREYQRVAGEALAFDLPTEGTAIWNMTAGLKRNLIMLLTAAYRFSRQNGREKMGLMDLKGAYASPVYAAQRRDIELLIRQAIEGRPSRKDLWSPISNLSSGKPHYRDALRSARDTAVAGATTKAALTANERRAAKQIEKDDILYQVSSAPSVDKKSRQKGGQSAASLVEAANLFSMIRKK